MSSLKQLLAEEGFERGNGFITKPHKPPLTKHSRTALPQDDSITLLPIYICHDRKKLDNSNKNTFKRTGSSIISSKKADSDSNSNLNSNPNANEPAAIDQIAVKAVISILTGYIGKYLRDANFRQIVRNKCFSCLKHEFDDDSTDSNNGVFVNLELGIESIENLHQDHEETTKKEFRMKTLRHSVRLLTNVASLNSKNTKNGFTNGVPNSYFSACAQLYLSIVYKLEKNDRISAKHLLQVFCDAPFIARTVLLPDLWEHFFLPHLLHLKIWYTKELEMIAESDDYGEGKEKCLKVLSKVYNDQMDIGTTLFALYYKQWLKVGAQAPQVPSVPLPSRPTYGFSRRTSSDSLGLQSSINKNLYQTIFGSSYDRRSLEIDSRSRGSINTWGLEEQEKACVHEYRSSDLSSNSYASVDRARQRSSSRQLYRTPKAELLPETQKTDYFWFLTCKTEATDRFVSQSNIERNGSIRSKEKTQVPSSELTRAVATLCSSDSLENCEMAIRVITKVWLDSHGNLSVESALSKAPVIEAMLEVLLASNDDEVLELAISVLVELVARNEANRQIILSSDPQLEIFIKLLKSSSLFLKGGILLYLLKPKAKQMVSTEWVPLILRVLEFGDQLQTLFTVRCSPQVAAFYFLDQLLTGFDDQDRNFENARQVVSLGGLSLVLRRIESGDIHDRNNAASIIYCCVQADRSCRNYLASNLNTACILELFILGNSGSPLALLFELICTNRRTVVTKFLNGLISGGCSLNTLHIFFVCLQRASPEERPLVASILLQLDLMGDHSKCSIYREEVMDVLIECLDSTKCSEAVQEQSVRALLMLGGRFSHTGKATMENWLLRKAGFDETYDDSFQEKNIIVDEYVNFNEEEQAAKNWQTKVADVLLTSGSTRLLKALSDSIENSIPKLAWASLVTVSWLSFFLSSIRDEPYRTTVSSILVPQLLKSLNYDRDQEERVLASFSLFNLIKTSDSISTFSEAFDKKVVGLLQNLSLVTWTAHELLSIIIPVKSPVPI